MHIWVDADACPVAIKQILFRMADRMGQPLTLVANRLLRVPPSPYIHSLQVPMGFDAADRHIEQIAASGDLVITADIPLAAQVIARGAFALNPRGEFYSSENIRERLAVRDFMEGMRGAGADIAGPDALSQADRQAFARQLEQFLARRRS